MKKDKERINNLENEIGRSIGNYTSTNAQNASQASIDGMSLFRDKVFGKTIQNGRFETGKGSLFEYIEAAKFNSEAAFKGSTLRAEVTDVYDSKAAADILIKDNGETVREVQAKFSKTNCLGRDNSAASSVFDQAGGQNGHWGKYNGMERLIRKEENYNKDGSLLKEAQKLAKARGEKPTIHADDYKDVAENLTDELSHGNISSGGTTYEEVKNAYNNPEKYIENFERQHFRQEILTTTTSMATASFVTTGIISGVFNFYKVWKNEKTAKEALADTAKEATKGAIRGAATGAISSSIRIVGVKTGNEFLSNGSSSMAIAGGIIDGGVALFKYAKGEIDASQLKGELVASVVKSTSMIFIANALTTMTGGAVNPFISMAIYVSLGSVINCCKEIIVNAKMNIAQSEKLTAIYNESLKEREKQYKELVGYLKSFTLEQRRQFNTFLDKFNYNFETGENYDEAINAIVEISNYLNIELKHVEFNDFKNAMKNDEPFKLE